MDYSQTSIEQHFPCKISTRPANDNEREYDMSNPFEAMAKTIDQQVVVMNRMQDTIESQHKAMEMLVTAMRAQNDRISALEQRMLEQEDETENVKGFLAL